MFGPIFSREALTAPRQPRFYAIRTLFVAGLLGLILSAWQLLVGTQDIRNPGDLARFAAATFPLLALLLVTVAVVFSALFSAAAAAHEKDRKTIILLLLTDLTNWELVVGKLMASMLTVLVTLAAAAPLLMLLTLLGGVSAGQVGRVLAVTAVSSLAAGSLGSTLALWREKTFQALALTALTLVLWLIVWEVVHRGSFGPEVLGVPCTDLASAMSPWRAVEAASLPAFVGEAASGASPATIVNRFLIAAAAIALALNGVAIAMVRVWNPSREARPQQATDDDAEPVADDGRTASDVHAAGGKARTVWANPILWREVCTWAYGKKILIVKLGYLAIFAAAVAAALAPSAGPSATASAVPPAALVLAPMLVVSVVLVNAMSVTSLTGERDVKALDLLLATDLSPTELIFGKLGGAIYNAREMILLPLALVVYLWWAGSLSGENLFFLLVGLIVVDFFAAVLGLHAGMMYPSSRNAIAASLGTLLFLFLGVSTCMRMMLALADSFENQLATFLGFMLGGGLVLFAVLAWRNPSPAMGLACFLAPAAIFIAITNFLLGDYGPTFLLTVATFGFGAAAMLVPALSEFDVATGRTTARD
ncbi:MAG: ABC transporter permease subunit [Planctomycetota bacterium]